MRSRWQFRVKRVSARHRPSSTRKRTSPPTPYMGKWVALRGGKVIASDLSAKALRDHEEVRPTDAIVPVPRSRAGYFIA